jgi:primosomal protein N' (replication factor Y)
MKAKEISAIKILGPIPAPMERRIGKHRAQLLLQSDKRNSLQKLLQKLVIEVENHPMAKTVRWSLDVDPIDMY